MRRHKRSSSDIESIDESDTESQTSNSRHNQKHMVVPPLRRPSLLAVAGRHHYGSFYLRMGAVGKTMSWVLSQHNMFPYCVHIYCPLMSTFYIAVYVRKLSDIKAFKTILIVKLLCLSFNFFRYLVYLIADTE